MRCPACAHQETRVVDSRMSGDGAAIRRRRECLRCRKRFTTYEYIEKVPLLVVKKDGRRQTYDRSKIIAGIVKACEKRPIGAEKIEAVTGEIERILQRRYDREVASEAIGELVMERLADLDEVAYVRFASVYRRFKDVKQFMEELDGILQRERKEPGAA